MHRESLYGNGTHHYIALFLLSVKKGVKIVIPYTDVSAYNDPKDPEDSRVLAGTIDANPICDEGKRLSDAAEYIVNRLTQNGVTSGTIAFHGNSYYQPAFREYIEANSSFSVVDGFVSDGIDNTPTIRNMVENNDIVAVYNPLGSPDEWSAVLGQSPKQRQNRLYSRRYK